MGFHIRWTGKSCRAKITSVGLNVLMNVFIMSSGGSGLPEPENPTGFEPYCQTRSNPNPNISGFLKPEPESQTRGYQNVPKIKKNQVILTLCYLKY